MSRVAIPRVVSPELKPALDAITELLEVGAGLRGSGAGRFLTVADIEGAGLAVRRGGSVVRLDPDTEQPVDLTPPPAVTGLSATGALSAILLEWDAVAVHNYAYTEIWRAEANDREQAVRVGVATGTLYADAVDLDRTYFYWVRAVSTANVMGPWNTAYNAGTPGSTPEAASEILGKLTEQIRPDQIVWKTQVVYETGLFAIVSPRADGDEGLVTPFVVGTVDGQSTVGIDGLLVVDGSITTNAIRAGAVTADRVSTATLSALSANLGEVSAGTLDVGTGSWKVRISDNGYPVEFRNIFSGERKFALDALGNAYFKGEIQATSGTFLGAITAGSTISGAEIIGGKLDIGTPGFHVGENGDAWAGHEDYASAPFRLETGGQVHSGLGSASTHLSNGQLWTGSSSFAAAPFRVDAAGNLWATSIHSASMAGADQPEIDNLWMDAAYIKNLTADRILAGELQAGVVVAGSLVAGEITAATINAERITAGTLAVDRLEAGTAYIRNPDMISQGTVSVAAYDFDASVTVPPSGGVNAVSATLNGQGGLVVLTFSAIISWSNLTGGAGCYVDFYCDTELLQRIEVRDMNAPFSYTVLKPSGTDGNKGYYVRLVRGVGSDPMMFSSCLLVVRGHKR